MVRIRRHFRSSSFFSFLCWECLIFVIEMFFVIAPITSSYIHMAIVMLLSVAGAALAAFYSKKNTIKMDLFLVSFLCFHVFVSLRAVMTGTNRAYTDLLFYWCGLMIVILAHLLPIDGYKTEEIVMKSLIFFGLFFSAGVFLQMIFTDQFLKYQLPMLESEFSSSLRRQVVFHQMFTGWTTQTFATCINLMLGIYASLLAWEKKHSKRYIATAAVMFVAVLLTGKRGPLIFMILAYILANIILSGSFNKVIKSISKYAICVLIAIVGLFGYVTIYGSTSRNSIVRLIELFNDSGSGQDVSNGRFELWGLALKLFSSSPIFGVGWRRYHELALVYLHEDIETHNVYLQLLAECGILGLVVYLIPVLSGLFFTISYLKRMRAYRRGSIYQLMKLSLAVQLFLFFYAFTGNTLYDYCAQICYYFAFAICTYAKSHAKVSWREICQWIK